MLAKFRQWPDRASFRFRYGCFSDVSLSPWPHGYRELFLYGLMERDQLAMWHKILRPGDVVVDGGANWGFWSLVANKLVGESGKVYSFEPVKKTFQHLQHNLSISGANSVKAINAALSNIECDLLLNLAGDDAISVLSSVAKAPGVNWASMETCRAVPLEKEIGVGEPIRLIKLDVEGSELAALEGAETLLRSQNPPAITFEWNQDTAGAAGYSPHKTLQFLEKFGYRFFLPDGQRLIPFKPRFQDGWFPMVWALTQTQRAEMGNFII